MNVLLTSATGYIGSAVAAALQASGHGDRARHLLNWVPEAPSVLKELSKGSYHHSAIAAA